MRPASDPPGFRCRPVGRARTLAGEFPVYQAQIKGSVGLGRYTLEVPSIRFSDVNPIPGSPAGNIGSQFLKQFVATLDAANYRVRFEQAEPNGTPH